MAGNWWRIPRALRKSGMSDRISTKEGTLISIVDVEVFMRFSFRSVVWQPYSNGKRPPALTLNRPCAVGQHFGHAVGDFVGVVAHADDGVRAHLACVLEH